MQAPAPRAHATFSASSASRWMACPGSVARVAAAPARPESPYAKEGTDAHHVGEVGLRNGCRSARQAWAEHSDFWMLDVNAEMCDAVQDYLDYVFGLLDAHPGAQMIVEQRFDVPTLNASGEVYGTNDVAVYVPSLSRLYVIDYKHGAGVAVDVVGNKQLLMYGAGAVFGGSLNAPASEVVLVIVQPRAFHPQGPVREWTVGIDTLLDFVCDVEAAIEACQKPDAPLSPGETQCRWCAAKSACPALEARALSVIGTTFASVKHVNAATLPDPATMDAARIAYILGAKDLLTSWLADVEDHAKGLMRHGFAVPGYKIVEARAQRKWYGEGEDVAAKLVALAGASFDDVMPRKLIGVTAAEKLVVRAFKAKAGRAKANAAADEARQAMAFLTLKDTSGNVTLVPETDARPAVSVAQSTFGSVQLPP